MEEQIVQVPASLLLSAALSTSSKLLWMAARLNPGPPPKARTSWLSRLTGLSRPTVIKGLTELSAQGWDPACDAPTALAIPVPGPLLTNRRLSPQARVLYGILLLTPGYRHPVGRTSYDHLAAFAHTCRNTVAKALAELVRAEWIKADRTNRLAPIQFELTFPGRERGEVALAAAQHRLNQRGTPFGEQLMREYLTLLIDSDVYEENATPGFLLNPRTRAPLQFDRFYPPNVAFEYNGPQHYRPTKLYPLETVAAQRERDYIKMGICMERGISLVVIHASDLTLERMKQKVPPAMPLRDLRGFDLLIYHLESESETHRRRMERI